MMSAIARWLRALLGRPSEVYILVDRFEDNPQAAILGVHARRQGADDQAATLAKRYGEAQYPGTGSAATAIAKLHDHFVIVNRDVQDDDQ